MIEKRGATYWYCGLSLAVSTIGVVAVAATLKSIGERYREFFNDVLGGKPLPMLTEFVLSIAKTLSPALGGLLLGILILLAGSTLLYAAPDDRSAYRLTVGFILTTWILIALLLGVVWLAFSLPMAHVTVGMQEQT